MEMEGTEMKDMEMEAMEVEASVEMGLFRPR